MTSRLRSDALKADVLSVLRDGVDTRTFPGAVASLISGVDDVHLSFGSETYDPDAPAIAEDAIFDVASLTKVVATTTAIMQIVERGRLSLSHPASAFLPQLATPSKSGITIAHLLAHTAGFPGGEPLLPYRTPETMWDAIWSMDLAAPGTMRVYDDVGFMLLGRIVETIVGIPLDRYCENEIFAPLGMRETMFSPPEILLHRIVPTEIDPARGGLLRGTAHDERAANLGGVAGHAGLFSTARDLGRFARFLIGQWRGEERGAVLSGASVRRMWSRQWRDAEGEYGLGWDRLRPSYMNGLDDPDAVGHTGFTGTSLVISPRRDLAMILLSNRIHPVRSDSGPIGLVRRRFVEAALRAC